MAEPADRRPLRLLLATDSYPPFVGGADRQVQRIAYAMRDRGHEVRVLTPWQPGLPEEEVDREVRVHRPRALVTRVPWFSRDAGRRHHPPIPDPGTIAGVRRVLRALRPDVVHAYGWVAYSVAAALRGTRTPLLLSVRDYAPVCPIRTYLHVSGQVCSGPGLRKCLGCAATTYTLDEAGDAVLGDGDRPIHVRHRIKGAGKGIFATAAVAAGRPLLLGPLVGLHAVSSFVEEVMDEHLLGGRGDVIRTVIPSFLDEDADGAPDPAALARLPSEPYLLFVGHLLPNKGVHVLLRAYEALGVGRPPLVLLGPAFHSSPRELPAGAIALGSVSHPTVLAAWDRALLGVLPSVGAETFGNVVVEAMSRGKPMIASRIGGIVDIVRDGIDGLLVPPGDVAALARAIADLLDDPGRREALGAAARERAERFRAAAVLPRIEALYHAVAADPPRRRRHALPSESTDRS